MTDEEIIEALATRVMVWVTVKGRSDALAATWEWNPLTDPAHSKQVRDRLRELGWTMNLLARRKEHLVVPYQCWFSQAESYEIGVPRFYGDASTEERAVAIAALRAVGVEV